MITYKMIDAASIVLNKWDTTIPYSIVRSALEAAFAAKDAPIALSCPLCAKLNKERNRRFGKLRSYAGATSNEEPR